MSAIPLWQGAAETRLHHPRSERMPASERPAERRSFVSFSSISARLAPALLTSLSGTRSPAFPKTATQRADSGSTEFNLKGTAECPGQWVRGRPAGRTRGCQQRAVIVDDETSALWAEVQLVGIVPFAGFGSAMLLGMAAALAVHAQHFAGNALVRANATSELPAVSDHAHFPGLGVRGSIEGRQVLMGSALAMTELVASQSNALRLSPKGDGLVGLFLAIDGHVVAILHFRLSPLPLATTAIARLQPDASLHFVTSHDATAADNLAACLGRFDEVRAEMLPDDRDRYLEQLRAGGRPVKIVDHIAA